MRRISDPFQNYQYYKKFAKVILKQPSVYVERTSIYNPTQSSFRKGHSTGTFLLKVRDNIQKALNKNKMRNT